MPRLPRRPDGQERQRPRDRPRRRQVRRIGPRRPRPRVRGLPQGPREDARTSRTPRSSRRSTARPATTPRSTPTTVEHPRGRAPAGSAASVAATCVDCHSTHEIRSPKDPESRPIRLNLPATCGRATAIRAIIAQGHIRIGNVAELYKDSIHGRAVSKSGLLVAANCTTATAATTSGRSTDPASRVFRANVPATCGSVPRGHQDAVRRRRARRSARQGQPEGAGLRRLPHRAPDPARRRDVLAAGRHPRVRHVPRRQDQDLPRHVPRPGHVARVRARRDVRGLPRRPRDPAEVRPAVDRRDGRPARDVPDVPPDGDRELRRSTTRTPTRTTATATRCSTTPRSS